MTAIQGLVTDTRTSSSIRVYEPAATTNRETIERCGRLDDRGCLAEVAAQTWTDAGFEDAMTARWLFARCFDARAARALTELGVTPEQAAVRTRDGGEGHIDTIGWKVANRDLTPRQGAARSLSSR